MQQVSPQHTPSGKAPSYRSPLVQQPTRQTKVPAFLFHLLKKLVDPTQTVAVRPRV